MLRQRRSAAGVNNGFASVDNTMYSYEQTRRGLSYLYTKRLVLDDGVSTVPLALLKCPLFASTHREKESET